MGMKKICSLLTILLALGVSEGRAALNEWRSIKTVCAVKNTKLMSKPYAILDFVVRDPTGIGSRESVLAESYSKEDFPIKNFRVVGSPSVSYRIVTEAFEEAYARGEYSVHLAIYEERDRQLIRRAFSGVSLDGLRNQFRFGYTAPESTHSITCYSYAVDEVSKRPTDTKKRVPAQAVETKKVK